MLFCNVLVTKHKLKTESANNVRRYIILYFLDEKHNSCQLVE